MRAPAPVSDGLQVAVRDTFGLTPEIVVLDAGTLAKEFESCGEDAALCGPAAMK